MVEAIEVWWSLIAAAGVSGAAVAFGLSWGDIRYLKSDDPRAKEFREESARQWHAALVNAQGSLLRVFFKGGAQVFGLVVGIASMFRPPPDVAHEPGRDFLIFLLIAMNLFITSATVIDVLYRNKLYAALGHYTKANGNGTARRREQRLGG